MVGQVIVLNILNVCRSAKSSAQIIKDAIVNKNIVNIGELEDKLSNMFKGQHEV